jgi:hypothetical protein
MNWLAKHNTTLLFFWLGTGSAEIAQASFNALNYSILPIISFSNSKYKNM